jgi:citrate lyase beta subunit
MYKIFSLPGATRTNDAKELMYARQKIINCAKAYRLQAIDMVYIDYKGKVFKVDYIGFL